MRLIYVYVVLLILLLAAAFKAQAEDNTPKEIQECYTDWECYIAAKKLCDNGSEYWCRVAKATLWGAYDVVNGETDHDGNGWPDWMDDDSIDSRD